MEKFFAKTKNVIFSKQGSIVSSALLLSVMIITSRLFGFIRYRTLAGFFTKEELDIFFASFRIPDLVFEILITGALTSTFIPIFIRYQNNKKELSESISTIINTIFLSLTFFIVVLSIFLDVLMPFIAPGYSKVKNEQIVYYSRLLLLGQLPFLVLGNFLTGIGQANKTFMLTAIAPVLYNVAIIVATIFFASKLFLLAPILGVIVGSFIFLLVQLPLLAHSDFTYAFVIKKTKGLIEFFRMMVPRAFTVIVAQIDATIDLTLTTFLGAGSYTVFYLAQHLQLLPVSVIGIAFGQASLPYLSEMHAQGKTEEFKNVVIQSILNLFFLTIPVMSFFVFARTPLVRLFFGGQKFDWGGTVLTALTLSYFSLSLPFHSIYYFLTRCFYALLDSRTPFYISVFSIALNTALSLLFIFVFHLPVWALAISFSASMIINVIFLFLILTRKLKQVSLEPFFKEVGKIVSATFISSVVSYYSMKLLDGLVFDTSRTLNVFFLLLTGTIIYTLLFLLLSWLLEVKEIYLVGRLILKAKEYQKKFVEIYTNYE